MHIRFRDTVVNILPQVYEPSEDTFLLAEAALSEIVNSERVLEVGCGSGLISAIIKSNTGASVVGIDINPFAVKCSRENEVETIRCDLLGPIKGKFDIILFNPPYLPTNEDERTEGWLNVALDGGNDGRKIIYRFIKEANDCLEDNGKILLLVSSLSGIEDIRSSIQSLGYSVREKVTERFDFEEIVVLVATKSSS